MQRLAVPGEKVNSTRKAMRAGKMVVPKRVPLEERDRNTLSDLESFELMLHGSYYQPDYQKVDGNCIVDGDIIPTVDVVLDVTDAGIVVAQFCKSDESYIRTFLEK